MPSRWTTSGRGLRRQLSRCWLIQRWAPGLADGLLPGPQRWVAGISAACPPARPLRGRAVPRPRAPGGPHSNTNNDNTVCVCVCVRPAHIVQLARFSREQVDFLEKSICWIFSSLECIDSLDFPEESQLRTSYQNLEINDLHLCAVAAQPPPSRVRAEKAGPVRLCVRRLCCRAGECTQPPINAPAQPAPACVYYVRDCAPSETDQGGQQGVSAGYLLRSKSALAACYREDPGLLEKHHRRTFHAPTQAPGAMPVCLISSALHAKEKLFR